MSQERFTYCPAHDYVDPGFSPSECAACKALNVAAAPRPAEQPAPRITCVNCLGSKGTWIDRKDPRNSTYLQDNDADEFQPCEECHGTGDVSYEVSSDNPLNVCGFHGGCSQETCTICFCMGADSVRNKLAGAEQPSAAAPQGVVPGHCVDIDGNSWHKDGEACEKCGFGIPTAAPSAEAPSYGTASMCKRHLDEDATVDLAHCVICSARREGLEESARLVCFGCKKGFNLSDVPAGYMPNYGTHSGGWIHTNVEESNAGLVPCHAAEIWAALAQREGK